MGNSFEEQMDKLSKGGKPAAIGEIRTFGGKQFQKMGDGNWKLHVLKEEKQLEAEQNKNKVVSLTDKLKGKIAEKKEVSATSQHLSDLKTQAVVPDQKTRSEKPIFTQVDAAMAAGYKAADFREAGNFFYDRAQKIADNISKLEGTKQEVDPNFKKIKDVNVRMARTFLNQANHIDDHRSVSKSTVMMGHNDGAEINTSSFILEQQAAGKQGWWLETMSRIMDGYSYGDVPRVIPMTQGDLYLVKVDDGMYSGVFKKITHTPEGTMEDNAKVRLERMTLPSLVSFCLAKQWMDPVSREEIKPEQTLDLVHKLEAPMVDPVPVEPIMNVAPVVPEVAPHITAKIRMLELLDKLVN